MYKYLTILALAASLSACTYYPAMERGKHHGHHMPAAEQAKPQCQHKPCPCCQGGSKAAQTRLPDSRW